VDNNEPLAGAPGEVSRFMGEIKTVARAIPS
jgi:hypothetical protein